MLCHNNCTPKDPFKGFRLVARNLLNMYQTNRPFRGVSIVSCPPTIAWLPVSLHKRPIRGVSIGARNIYGNKRPIRGVSIVCYLPLFVTKRDNNCSSKVTLHKRPRRGFLVFVKKTYGTTDPSEGVPLFSTHLPLYQKQRILPLPINSPP
jgi:hypothetical protein